MTQTTALATVTAQADLDAQIPESSTGNYFMDGKLLETGMTARLGPVDDRAHLIRAILSLSKFYDPTSLLVNGTPIKLGRIVPVQVTLTIDVDTELWTQAYGTDHVALMDDVQAHVTETVRYHAAEGLRALGAGATVRD